MGVCGERSHSIYLSVDEVKNFALVAVGRTYVAAYCAPALNSHNSLSRSQRLSPTHSHSLQGLNTSTSPSLCHDRTTSFGLHRQLYRRSTAVPASETRSQPILHRRRGSAALRSRLLLWPPRRPRAAPRSTSGGRHGGLGSCTRSAVGLHRQSDRQETRVRREAVEASRSSSHFHGRPRPPRPQPSFFALQAGLLSSHYLNFCFLS